MSNNSELEHVRVVLQSSVVETGIVRGSRSTSQFPKKTYQRIRNFALISRLRTFFRSSLSKRHISGNSEKFELGHFSSGGHRHGYRGWITTSENIGSDIGVPLLNWIDLLRMGNSFRGLLGFLCPRIPIGFQTWTLSEDDTSCQKLCLRTRIRNYFWYDFSKINCVLTFHFGTWAWNYLPLKPLTSHTYGHRGLETLARSSAGPEPTA